MTSRVDTTPWHPDQIAVAKDLHQVPVSESQFQEKVGHCTVLSTYVLCTNLDRAYYVLMFEHTIKNQTAKHRENHINNGTVTPLVRSKCVWAVATNSSHIDENSKLRGTRCFAIAINSSDDLDDVVMCTSNW